MKKINIKKYLIDLDSDLRSAMKRLDMSQSKILFVINKNKTLYGSITDGDIRRWILKSNNIDAKIEKVCNPNPISSKENYNPEDLNNVMIKKGIQAVPVLNKDNIIIKILFRESIVNFKQEDLFDINKKIPVVVMAGGAGTRLEPFTKILPKPLIPIGEKSILEVIIDKFKLFGLDEYYLTVFHKKNIIKSYFEEIDLDYKLSFIEESSPMGTAGILSSLHSKVKTSFFLTNCDTIIDCNYKKIFEFHDNNKYDITIVGSMINYRIPYGICDIEKEGKLISIAEKPEFSYLVSTGMYLIRKSALDFLPKNKPYDITNLIEDVKNNKGSVGVYPISEKSWLDTGQWHEYKETLNQLTL